MSERFAVEMEVRAEMDAAHKGREMALATCRQIIQHSAKSIRNVHRGQFEDARTLLGEAQKLSTGAREALRGLPALEYAGYLQDAEKEMVEAACVLAIAQNLPTPTRQELKVDVTSYLNGLGEAASEVRRYVLDQMRRGSMDEAERLLAWMEEVYDELITFDYPDGLTGGLRRTCDALRAVVERTRSDLTLTHSQRELLKALKANLAE